MTDSLGSETEASMITPIPHGPAQGETDCEHALTHLYEYLDSEMTPQDEQRMRAHVAHCSPCLAELSTEELVKQLVKRSCAERAPAALRLRIHEQLTSIAAGGA